jgi:hypothetical protein
MNTQPAQPITDNGKHPDQQCNDIDRSDQAMTAINAAQLVLQP